MAGITFQVLKYAPEINPDHVLLNAVMTGNYVTGQGGTTVNLNPSTFADPNGIGILGEPLALPKLPPYVEACALANGVYAQLNVGTNLSNCQIELFTNAAGELGNGAYPAGTLIIDLPLR